MQVPHDPEDCRRLYHGYADFLRGQGKTIRELIANRTLDEEMQEKIYTVLMPMIVRDQ